eukprot:m.27040 g.27040  ORF g.27040 m.27040 type:complete len:629 (-) comp8427_c0_seq2:123-2009(-)
MADNASRGAAVSERAATNEEGSTSPLLYQTHTALDVQPRLGRKGRIPGTLRLTMQESKGKSRTMLSWHMDEGASDAVPSAKQYEFCHRLDSVLQLQRRGSVLIVTLRTLTLPPLHFETTTSLKEFLSCLRPFRVCQAPNDANTWVHESSPKLTQSLDDLGLDSFADTMREAKWSLLGGLSQVTKFTREHLFESGPRPFLSDPMVDAPDDLARTASGQADPLTPSFPCRERTETDIGSFDVISPIKELKDPAQRKTGKRTPPMTRQQFESCFDSKGRVRDESKLREMLFYGGAAPEVRRDAWCFLLNHRSPSTGETETWRQKRCKEYEAMKTQWRTLSEDQLRHNAAWRDTFSRVAKDVRRTDRSLDFFAGEDNENLKVLSDVLLTYCAYDADLGYVQGMNDLLAVILTVVEDEVDAFWCFANLMEKMQTNFAMDQLGMTQQLEQLCSLLRFVDPEFMDYLEKHESGGLFFCFRWMLISFKREFSMDGIKTLWEALWSQWLSPEFHMFVCLAILIQHRDDIMTAELDFEHILKFVNDLSGKLDPEEVLLTAEVAYQRLAEYNLKVMPENIRVLMATWQQRAESQAEGQGRDTASPMTVSSVAHSWQELGGDSDRDSVVSDAVVVGHPPA